MNPSNDAGSHTRNNIFKTINYLKFYGFLPPAGRLHQTGQKPHPRHRSSNTEFYFKFDNFDKIDNFCCLFSHSTLWRFLFAITRCHGGSHEPDQRRHTDPHRRA